jgi:hypothetical protein
LSASGGKILGIASPRDAARRYSADFRIAPHAKRCKAAADLEGFVHSAAAEGMDAEGMDADRDNGSASVRVRVSEFAWWRPSIGLRPFKAIL